MKFIWRGYAWRFYIASFRDFANSEDRKVRNAWWYLWHDGQPQVPSNNRCYRIFGLTLFGRKVRSV